MDEGLVFIGKIIELAPIPGADFIMSATVICGKGGKWRGVVRLQDFAFDDKCIVYLPDSLIPPGLEMKFLEKDKWRVKMKRFKGAPSEVLIMPIPKDWTLPIGTDITTELKVTKYHKPIPANMQGIAKGDFPNFIPKTDEPNYQSNPELVDSLIGLPYVITEKADGSSSTAYRYKGEFGVCSRNYELERNEDNGYWKIAFRYKLEELLPEGYAIQWETCGPKIQSNPMGLNRIEAHAFNVYHIHRHRYLESYEFIEFCEDLNFPTVNCITSGDKFDKTNMEILGEGKYDNGKEREGVVIRSIYNELGDKPISFKVINLNYEK